MSLQLKDDFLTFLASMLYEVMSDDDEDDIIPIVAAQESLQEKYRKEVKMKSKPSKDDSKLVSRKILKEARYLQKTRFEKFEEPVIIEIFRDNLCKNTLKPINGVCLCPEHIDMSKMRDVSVVVVQKGGGPGLSDIDFKTHWRMTRITVERIYSLINPPGTEAVVTPMELLAILWHFVTNDPIEHLESRFNINKGTIQTLELTVLERLCCHRPLLEVWPTGAAVNIIENGFSKSGLSAFGAVAITHFQCVKAPFNPKRFVNSLGNTTVSFQLVSDHRGSFTHNSYFFWPGRDDARNIYSASKLKKLPVPKESFLVGGVGYVKAKNIISPYRGDVTQAQYEFNRRHKMCMKVIEDAVLRLVSRFKILTALPTNQSSYIRQLVCACILMHNLCVDLNDEVEIDLSIQVEDFFPSPVVLTKQCYTPAIKRRNEICENISSIVPSEVNTRMFKKIRLDIGSNKSNNKSVRVETVTVTDMDLNKSLLN